MRPSSSTWPSATPDDWANCPVVVGSQVTQPEELILRGTLADIADQVEAAGLTQAAVIIVGWALAAEDFVESHLYSSRPARPAAPEGRAVPLV